MCVQWRGSKESAMHLGAEPLHLSLHFVVYGLSREWLDPACRDRDTLCGGSVGTKSLLLVLALFLLLKKIVPLATKCWILAFLMVVVVLH